MADPEPHSPGWYNAIADRAVQRIIALAKPAIARYTDGGYIGGFAPVDLPTLEAMPTQDALGILENMMRMPTSRADGVHLFGQYLGWLERTGQLAAGVGKMLAGQMAQTEAGALTDVVPGEAG